jgi:Xaa-Pro aminopeptidase
LRKAANLGTEGFEYLLEIIREGISEAELAVELEIFWKRKGSRGLSFQPIIAFGASSSMPHWRASSARLKKGDAILIDIGVHYHHYHSDMTRVVYFKEADPKMVEIHSIVQEAQQLALSLCKPGVKIGELDKTARDSITKRGYGAHFTHSLGHGIGLEIHELPTLRSGSPQSDLLLEPGMCITIEPGIYLAGVGGVRLEDTVVITESGYENLTKPSKDVRVVG